MFLFKDILEQASNGRIKVEIYTPEFSGRKPRYWIWLKSEHCKGVAADFLKGPTRNFCCIPCLSSLRTPNRC